MTTSSPADRIPTLEWTGAGLRIIDQRRLPESEVYIECRRVEDLADAIRTLAVRGAPALGVAAAFGAVLAAMEAGPGGGFASQAEAALSLIESTRPTAVNLFRAVAAQRAVLAGCGDRDEAIRALLESAMRIMEEDLLASRLMGSHGASLLRPGVSLLTHCNAGGLATAGLGTALAVFYEAHARGWLERAWVDETRPLLQGARLTAWELSRAGIPVTLLPDSAAAGLLASGRVHAVFTGADRIAANGDTANKVGTYPLALASREAGVPFYVVAPLSTFDPDTPDGSCIRIEERSGAEVTGPPGARTAPPGIDVFNPAFDVTPASLVTSFVCELGVFTGPPLRPPAS